MTFRQKKPGGEPGAPKKIFRYMLDELSTNTYQIPCQKSVVGLKLYYLISTNDMIGILPDFCVQDFCIFALKMRWDED